MAMIRFSSMLFLDVIKAKFLIGSCKMIAKVQVFELWKHCGGMPEMSCCLTASCLKRKMHRRTYDCVCTGT